MLNELDKEWKAGPHQDFIKRFKGKLKSLTQRKWSISFTERLKKLNQVIRGWINYFRSATYGGSDIKKS